MMILTLGALFAASHLGSIANSAQPQVDSRYRAITLLQTNDIHGYVEPTVDAQKNHLGGFENFAHTVEKIRAEVAAAHGDHGAVVLVDGGDQFQGTLLSNYTEGRLVFYLMNQLRYDAVVPGNHDFDFGPPGWEQDSVDSPGQDPKNDPRGVLKQLVGSVAFPVISGNIYYKNTVTQDSTTGQKDYSQAKRLEFLRPYVIVKKAGVRVAIIGIDHKDTAKMTTASNVSDLVFREEVEAYQELRNQLAGRADLFIMVTHNGNVRDHAYVTEIVTRITALGNQHPDGAKWVDAVAAGHTHTIHQDWVGEVPILQSGANGRYFGKVQFVWDTQTRSLVPSKTEMKAGIEIRPPQTDLVPPTFTHLVIERLGKIGSAIRYVKEKLSGMLFDIVAIAPAKMTRDRILDSALAEELADGMLHIANGVDSDISVALINASGIRADIAPGPVPFERFYEVLPFSNHLVTASISGASLYEVLVASVRTCGAYGALIPAGIRVRFERHCEQAVAQIDPNAKILSIADSTGVEMTTEAFQAKTWKIATFDFLLGGGSGYQRLADGKLIQDLGVFRRLIVDYWKKSTVQPFPLRAQMDGRWVAE